ncbi:hypothetical protein WJX77_007966 [Trebouxia sp. C0004]
MNIDPGLVRTDFGQGVSDHAVFDKAAAIRTQVFQVEQGYDPEFDELDKESAIHFIAEVPTSIALEHDAQLIDGEFHAVAAGRIYQAFRGHGLGNIILKKMMDTAQRLGANRLILHSQANKTGFYMKHGFAVIQHEGKDWCFDEDGQPHVGMQLNCDNTY